MVSFLAMMYPMAPGAMVTDAFIEVSQFLFENEGWSYKYVSTDSVSNLGLLLVEVCEMMVTWCVEAITMHSIETPSSFKTIQSN